MGPSSLDPIFCGITLIFILKTCALFQTDLGRRKVDEAEGRLWAETRGFPYFETSALTGDNIQEMFELLIQRVAEVALGGPRPSRRAELDLAYTSEQAALVSRIRGCQDNYQILGVTKTCSK